MSTEIKLTRVDESRVYALPYGVTAEQIAFVYLDDILTDHVFVKSDTEIYVPLARLDSVVAIVLKDM